jgi:hypothetical protein
LKFLVDVVLALPNGMLVQISNIKDKRVYRTQNPIPENQPPAQGVVNDENAILVIVNPSFHMAY